MDLVTMAEAAQRLGVSIDTVRRRLRRGELQGRHQPTPQGFIWLVQVPEPADHGPIAGYVNRESSPTHGEENERPVLAGAGTPADAATSGGDIHALRELVDVLRHEIDTRDRQLETKDGQLKSKDRQIEQLHLMLKQAHFGSLQPVQPKGRTLGAQATKVD